MIFELQPYAFQSASPLFGAPYLEFVINAVVAENSQGRIWVDDPSSPRSAFLWDRGARYYFAGGEDNEAFNEAVGRVVREQIGPRPGSYLVAYYASDRWERELNGVFRGLALHKAQRGFYGLHSLGISDWRERIPQGFSVAPIDRQLLSRSGTTNLDQVLGEIQSGWPSVSRFLENGFGFCMLRGDDEVACWCTGEYASRNHIGVGIETIEEYRRQGLATLTASAFAEHCLSRGIEAHWDCWADNKPSIQVAERVGFRKILDYDVHRS